MKKSMLSLLAALLMVSTAQADNLDLWRVINVTSGAYVNLREHPGTESVVLERLAADLVNITLLNCDEYHGEGWCLVNVGDRKGWVSRHYIRQMNQAERKKYPHQGKAYRIHRDNASLTGQINRAGAPGIEKKKMEPVKEYPKPIHKKESSQNSDAAAQANASQGKNPGQSHEKNKHADQ